MPELQYVDFPGHGSLRFKLHDYFGAAKMAVMVVDATSTDAKLQVVAQYLFSLLVDPSFVKVRMDENNITKHFISSRPVDARRN